MKVFRFSGLWNGNGWLPNAYVSVDEQGKITRVNTTAPEDTGIEVVPGYALPGFVNGHSHTFQYAMAGHAERHAPQTEDDFWSWREKMYQCALTISPEEVEAIAELAFQDMLQRGFTEVVEFHYLHRDPQGNAYQNPAELGWRIARAAQKTGIKLTLVPVYYKTGNFNTPAFPGQRRFLCSSPDQYLGLLESTERITSLIPEVRVASGIHSLRAVPPDEINEIVKFRPDMPFHLHAAEQQKEVSDCRHALGLPPVEWILENLDHQKLFLVHCTHLTTREVSLLAESGHGAVLCPSTEGNLGDGIFELPAFTNLGGNWCIGTDSQVCMSPFEDLRWLDYSQRLRSHRRNTFANAAEVMMNSVARTGRLASGSRPEFFQPDQPFDACVMAETDRIARAPWEEKLAVMVYTADSASILGTVINGQWRFRRKMGL